LATSFRHFSTWLAGIPGGGGGSCSGIFPLLHGESAATASNLSLMGIAMPPVDSLLEWTDPSPIVILALFLSVLTCTYLLLGTNSSELCSYSSFHIFLDFDKAW
jgi:hypothetical protein